MKRKTESLFKKILNIREKEASKSPRKSDIELIDECTSFLLEMQNKKKALTEEQVAEKVNRIPFLSDKKISEIKIKRLIVKTSVVSTAVLTVTFCAFSQFSKDTVVNGSFKKLFSGITETETIKLAKAVTTEVSTEEKTTSEPETVYENTTEETTKHNPYDEVFKSMSPEDWEREAIKKVEQSLDGYYSDMHTVEKNPGELKEINCYCSEDTVFNSYDDIDFSKISVFGIYIDEENEETTKEIPTDEVTFSITSNNSLLKRATVTASYNSYSANAYVYYK